MRLSVFLATITVIGSLHACSGGSNQPEVQHPLQVTKDAQEIMKTRDTVTLLTTEDAETLVGKRYSALNREAQYLLYRYLLVKIDSIGVANEDTIPIFATVNGRKWLTPNGDTTTQSFRESIRLRAYRKDNGWQAN